MDESSKLAPTRHLLTYLKCKYLRIVTNTGLMKQWFSPPRTSNKEDIPNERVNE